MRKNLRLIILIAILAISLSALTILVQTGKIKNYAATTNAVLSLSPAIDSRTVGAIFPVDIMLNTGGQNALGVDVFLNFNPQELEVQDADLGKPGIQIQTASLYSSTIWNSADNATGKIIFQAVAGGGEQSFNGTGKLATINFKALKVASPTSVTFTFNGIGQTNDSNVALAGEASTDILGSVINSNITLTPADISATVLLELEGRPANSSTTNTTFEVRNIGQLSTIFQKNDLTTDSSGTGSATVTGLLSGNYDFKVKVSHWLAKKLDNQPLADLEVLDFGTLLGGDLLVDNVINGGDFTYLKQKLNTNDSVADINLDGTVNTLDYSLIYKNWGISGD